MLFEELMHLELPQVLRNAIMELLEIKKQSDEKDRGIQIPAIRDFISSELVRQKEYLEQIPDDRNRNWDKLNEVFIQTIIDPIKINSLEHVD
jgi:predicted nucleotidyltransferase